MITDSLGFPLNVTICVGIDDETLRGNHFTHVNAETGFVDVETPHKITVAAGLDGPELAEVASHECFHLFYSIRHLIAADEETQATVFGQLVKHIFTAAIGKPHP